MRLRIQTAPPLPPLKIWFTPEFRAPDVPNFNDATATTTTTTTTCSCDTNSDNVSMTWTIQDLKKTLCEHVPTLSEDKRCRANNIILSLKDFELLDRTLFTAGVRDEDLLVVGLKESNPKSEPMAIDCKVLKPEPVDCKVSKLEPDNNTPGTVRANENKRKHPDSEISKPHSPPPPCLAPSNKRPRAEEPSPAPPQQPQRANRIHYAPKKASGGHAPYKPLRRYTPDESDDDDPKEPQHTEFA